MRMRCNFINDAVACAIGSSLVLTSGIAIKNNLLLNPSDLKVMFIAAQAA